MAAERVRFAGAFGHELAGQLDRPEQGEPRGYVLFAHCFTCSKSIKTAGWLSRGLTQQGLAVLRFDFTGIGESKGEFAETNFSSNLDDLVAAADFLRAEHGRPAILFGHSLGGAACIAAAGRVPDCRAVVTLAAPSGTQHLAHTLLKMAPHLAEAGEAEVTIGGSKFRVRRQLIDDLEQHRLEESARQLERPLLLLHSPADETVGIEHAARLYQAARQPKSFIALDGADHLLFNDERNASWVADMVAAWAGKYLRQ